MRCTTCNKQIDGVEVFGNYRDEKCFTCWMDGEMLKNEPESDDRIGNIASRDIIKLREPVDCNWCKGTGKKSDGENCYKCEGSGKMIGKICDNCDGFGEVDHECECDICTEDMEPCRECNNGIKYVAYGQDDLVPNDLKTFWLQPG